MTSSILEICIRVFEVIIIADDVGHARQRKILSHAFSDKALKEQEPLLKKWAQLLRKKLAERADGEQEVDMVYFRRLSLSQTLANFFCLLFVGQILELHYL